MTRARFNRAYLGLLGCRVRDATCARLQCGVATVSLLLFPLFGLPVAALRAGQDQLVFPLHS
jgi:hypothetical protein